MLRAGYLDYCAQSHCAGWAAEDGRPAALELFLNGAKTADITCDIDRPDLEAAGFPRQAGFSHVFDAPLLTSDVVDVRFKGGPSLEGSPSVKHQARLKLMLQGVQTTEPGLELGPLDRPILGKPDYQVSYVDHASRAELIEKYRHSGTSATVRPERIREVDIIWNGRLSSITGQNYAYCLASHVLEHIADPIGWLIEIAEVLRPGGRLNLAIPEQTRGFDHLRTASTAAAMLDAHRLKLRRPSFAQIFDHISGVSPLDGPLPDKASAVRNAYQMANMAELTDAYLDVHCHVWNYQSFLACWQVINTLQLTLFSLVSLIEPFDEWNEFIVSLVRH